MLIKTRKQIMGAAILQMAHLAKQYSDQHAAIYGTPVGEDWILGVHVGDIFHACRGLLNGECGTLDCGSADAEILSLMKACGINE